MKNVFLLALNAIIFMGSMIFPLAAQEIAVEKVISDPFELSPGAMGPNCDKEYRFKYEININSVD